MSADQFPTSDRAHLIRWIMLAVLMWGLFLALGAYLFGGNLPALRALIIVAVVVAFLAFWWVALTVRQRRLELRSTTGDQPKP